MISRSLVYPFLGQWFMGGTLIFLGAMVLQTHNPTVCIDSPMCRVESPSGLFRQFLVLQTVGPTQQ